MVSLAQKLLLKLKGRDKSKILTHLNPDIEENLKIKEQSKYIQSLEAQISRIKANKKQKQDAKGEVEFEKQLVRGLDEKSKELQEERYNGAYPLRKLYYKIFKDKKFRRKLEIVDKDDKKVLDKFYSFVILPNQKIGIQGMSGNIWSEGYSLNEVVHKPETLKNQIRRGRILLPYDENFNFIPDLENIEFPEMSHDAETGDYNVSEERFKKFKQLIIERDTKINNLRKDKEHHEQVITDLRNKLASMELAKTNWKSQAESNKSELITSLKTVQEAYRVIGKLDKDLTVTTEQKILADEVKEKYENAFSRVLKELEDDKSKSVVRRAKDEVQYDIEWAQKRLPKIINTTITEEPRMSKESVNPGEKIGRAFDKI